MSSQVRYLEKNVDVIKDLSQRKGFFELSVSPSAHFTKNDLLELQGSEIEKINLASCKEVDDGFLEALASFNHLKEIILDTCDSFTDKGISYLAQIPLLKILSLRWCYTLTDLFVFSFQKSQSLEVLYLGVDIKLTNDGLSSLASFSNLKELELPGFSNFDDLGMKKLSESTSLEKISLYSNKQITDEGFLSLTKIKSLREIFVSENSISEQAFDSFRVQKPGCKLVIR